MEWAMKVQAIAPAGLTYSEGKYDLDRYRQLQEIAAEIMSTHSEHDYETVLQFLHDETGYATPKVDVRGVVFREGRVLLVKETIDGRWSLPGGWADTFLTASENTVKEIHEESGYEARAVRLLAVYDKARHHPPSPNPLSIYKIFFLCEITGGAPQESMETSDVGFFSLEELPPLSTGRTTEDEIIRMAELVDSGEVDWD
jgi:ADP-ribose pyrophosphatase YjhB (NUDIX family)